MSKTAEIESFLFSCGAKNREVDKLYIAYNFNGNRLTFFEINGDYFITMYGEGISVDLRKNKIKLYEEDFNEVKFNWPVDKALLCQILGILANRRICEGLNEEECRKFKRYLIAELL